MGYKRGEMGYEWGTIMVDFCSPEGIEIALDKWVYPW